MKECKEKLGEFDVLVTDLDPLYKPIIEKVFVATSVQFCVFHFFNILFREIVRPLWSEIKQEWQQELNECRKIMKRLFITSKGKLSPEEGKLWDRLSEVTLWSLERRKPYQLLTELSIFQLELKKRSFNDRITSSQEKVPVISNQLLMRELKELIKQLKVVQGKLMAVTNSKTYSSLQQYLMMLKDLFQETDTEKFSSDYQRIMNETSQSKNRHINRLGSYLQKYQDELSVFLQKGAEKTTSLLEQQFHRLKKTTSHHRGAHDDDSMLMYSEIYRYFWNIRPVQLVGEKASDKRSPISRLSDNTTSELSVNTTSDIFDMSKSIGYHDYRKQVNVKRNKRKTLWAAYKADTSSKKHVKDISYEESATARWSQSDTLQAVQEALMREVKAPVYDIPVPETARPLRPFDKKLLTVLSESTTGLTGSELCSLLQAARSTVYDCIVRLEVFGLVYRQSVPRKTCGRPVVRFHHRSSVPLPGS